MHDDHPLKIAVTSQNRKTITPHAGRCRRFWVYHVENNTIRDKQLLELAREESFFETGPREPHPLDDADVFITAGIGEGLVRRLHAHGTRSLVTSEEDPDRAVRKYLDGTLRYR